MLSRFHPIPGRYGRTDGRTEVVYRCCSQYLDQSTGQGAEASRSRSKFWKIPWPSSRGKFRQVSRWSSLQISWLMPYNFSSQPPTVSRIPVLHLTSCHSRSSQQRVKAQCPTFQSRPSVVLFYHHLALAYRHLSLCQIIPNLSHATSNERTGPTRQNWARDASAPP